MAESYSEDSSAASASTGNSVLNDTTLKWVGVGFAAAFTLVVGYLLTRVYQMADPQLMVQIFPRFVDAYLRVLQIVVISGALSLVGAVLVGFGRVSNTRFTHSIATGYVEFFRGTPLLFQLLVIYIGIPRLFGGAGFLFEDWRFPAAVIGLTLNHAAYGGEAIRGGINAVPDGQMEAARSLGMSYVQSMREVILPQAWRNALAALGNDQVILVKDTSLLTVIAFPELIHVFRNVNSTFFDPWSPIILVAVAYLGITLPLGKLVRYMESRAEWGSGSR
ncbi:MAG: amino acid ABC transporter permease [Haloferacaceae archaeon]